MRGQKQYHKKPVRVVQYMALNSDALAHDELRRFMDAFKDTLNKTKSWTLSRDFQGNVDEALEREKEK